MYRENTIKQKQELAICCYRLKRSAISHILNYVTVLGQNTTTGICLSNPTSNFG